jgi:hypothetical protein
MVRDRLEALVRVGDGGEKLAGPLVRASRVQLRLDARPGIGQERERLGGRAGLARDDPQRLERVQVVDHHADGRGIGGVEDPQVRVVVRRPERPVEHVRGEAGAAHAHDDRGVEARLANPVAEALERGGLEGEVLGRVQPAEPVRDGRGGVRIVRPERGVAVEQPIGPALVLGTCRELLELALPVAEVER